MLALVGRFESTLRQGEDTAPCPRGAASQLLKHRIHPLPPLSHFAVAYVNLLLAWSGKGLEATKCWVALIITLNYDTFLFLKVATAHRR